MRLVFLGTPAFAVPTLDAIVQAGHEVAAVITQPDRPKGRGQNAAFPPVKEAALRHGLAVFQPERVRRPEAVEYLRNIGAEAMVVVGYGQIIPQNVIDLAPLGIINVHASLLPKYRGAGPIQWSIANGDTRTGVTTMQIDAGLDTGDMLLKAETEIGPEETAPQLSERLAKMGGALLVETLARIDEIVPEKQDPAQATLAPLLTKEDGIVDWRMPAQAIHDRVRGLQPWPGAQTLFRGTPLRVWQTRVVKDRSGEPGTVLSTKPLLVGTGQDALLLLEVQQEGRKRIGAADFANGQRLTENERLGDPQS